MVQVKKRLHIRSKKLTRSIWGNLLMFLFIVGIGAIMALPLVYAIVTAFKPVNEIFLFPPRFFVIKPTLKNFSDLFSLMADSWIPFSRYIFNTVFILSLIHI